MQRVNHFWCNLFRKKSGKIKTAYKMDYLHMNCDVDFDFAGPTVHGAAVLGYVYYFTPYPHTHCSFAHRCAPLSHLCTSISLSSVIGTLSLNSIKALLCYCSKDITAVAVLR